MVFGTVKLRHRKSTMWPTTRGRDVSKEITKEFTIVFYETQYIVSRNSKLAGPRRSASNWINWHRKTTPTVYLEYMRYQKHWYLTQNKSGKECTDATSIRLPSRSHNHEPPPPRIRRTTCRTFSFNNIKDGTLPPQVVHGGIGTRPKTGGAHQNNSI